MYEALSVLPVLGGDALNEFPILVLHGSNPAGDADDHGVAGHPGVCQHDGTSTDNAVVLDLGILQKDGVDADHNVVPNAMAVENGAVGNHNVITDFQVVVGVQDAVVLDVGVTAHPDAAVVAA